MLILLLSLCFCACVSPDKNEPRKRGVKDIDKAISVIESRQRAERRIIEEQQAMIDVLENNLKNTKSEGMKKKIESEIQMKTIGIEKARKNIDNQNKVLQGLYSKRDSLSRME